MAEEAIKIQRRVFVLHCEQALGNETKSFITARKGTALAPLV